MANVPFSTLYDKILPYLPGAETPIVDNQMRKVLREFMTRTTMVRESFALTTTAGVSTYRLQPVYGQVCGILRVWPDGRHPPLPPVNEASAYPRENAKPVAWFAHIPDVISLYPTPDAAYTFYIDAATTATQDATEFPEELAHHYGEVIAAGVLAAMMSMPGKPWTQGDAAKSAARMYGGQLRELRARVREGGQPNNATFRGVVKFGA